MRRGDIIIVAPLPPFAKPRPAVILQSQVLEHHENVTVALITSDLARTTANRVLVQATQVNGLRRPSETMLDLIVTTPLDRVGGLVGALEPENMRRVDAALRLFLGL